MNRKQLLVVGVVVGLLLVGWMLGQRDYELHRRLTVSWARDPSPTGELIPWSAPASPPVDATIGCSGPLRPPDERLDVRSPGWAPTSFDGQHPIYLEPNPCIAERSARRRTLMLGAVAVLLLGLVGLIGFRTSTSTRDPEPGAPGRAGARRAAPGSGDGGIVSQPRVSRSRG